MGRPEITDETYTTWLHDMAPFLKVGYSLYSAIEKANLVNHKDSIYRKYRLNDWFCEKVEAFQKYPAEIVNSIFTRIVMRVEEKLIEGKEVTETEWRNVRFFAEKHRSCLVYFTNSTETLNLESDKIGKILDNLEDNTDYDYVASRAKEVMLKIQKEPSLVHSNPLQA